ncbi:hypothetical protein LTR15_002856 [Elasticomyces elasticus]|nr:hypothetical protein LTR15_002856 [Elasticomyces elasticus]
MGGQAEQDIIDGRLGDLDTILRVLGLTSNDNTSLKTFRTDRAPPHPLEDDAILFAAVTGNANNPRSLNREKHTLAYGYAKLNTANIRMLPPGANGGEWIKASTSYALRISGRQESREAKELTAGCMAGEVGTITARHAGISPLRIKTNKGPFVVIYDGYDGREPKPEVEGQVIFISIQKLYHEGKPDHEPVAYTLSGICKSLGIPAARKTLDVRERAELILATTLIITLKKAITIASTEDLPTVATSRGLANTVPAASTELVSRQQNVPAASTRVLEHSALKQQRLVGMANSIASKALVLPNPLPIERRADFDDYQFEVTKDDAEQYDRSGRLPEDVFEVFVRYSELTLSFGRCIIAQAQHHGYPNLEGIVSAHRTVDGPTRNWVHLARFLARADADHSDMAPFAGQIIKLRDFVSRFYRELAKALPDSEEVAAKTEGHEDFVRKMKQGKAILE